MAPWHHGERVGAVLGVLTRPFAMPARLRPLLERFTVAPEDRRRLVSVDALRAVAIMGMLLVNNHAAGAENPLQLVHVDWEGLRFADLVFPMFLFLAGVSMALSLGRKSTQPALRVWTKLASRIVALLAIGLVLNFYKYGEPLRYMGVLQRIALACALAAPLARRKPVYALLGAALMLLVHTSILLRTGAPGVVPGSFGAEDSIAYWIDMRVLGAGHLYRGNLFDPEGLLGVVSSAGQVMLGIAAGRFLLDQPRNLRALVWLALAGAGAALAGLAMEPWVPIVKSLWTSSYVLVTSGISALALAVLYAIGDLLRGERLLAPLTPPGRNALVLYIGSTMLLVWMKAFEFTPVGGTATNLHYYASDALTAAFGDTRGSLVYACGHAVVWYAVAAALDKARVYVRL